MPSLNSQCGIQLTTDLPDHRRSAAIVRAMLVLARQLEREVTVEGVETEPQFTFLRSEGCAEVQGYLFSPPKPATAFADLAALQFGAIAGSARSLAAAKLIGFGERRKRA